MTQQNDPLQQLIPQGNPWDLESVKKQLGNMFVHNMAEQQYLQRAAVALSYGISPHAVTRYEPKQEGEAPAQQVPARKNWLPLVLGAVAALSGGGIGGLAISQLLNIGQKVVTETIEVPGDAPSVEVISDVIPPE